MNTELDLQPFHRPQNLAKLDKDQLRKGSPPHETNPRHTVSLTDFIGLFEKQRFSRKSARPSHPNLELKNFQVFKLRPN